MPFHYGDVVWADIDPSKGHEQTKRRPLAVVIVRSSPVMSSAVGVPMPELLNINQRRTKRM